MSVNGNGNLRQNVWSDSELVTVEEKQINSVFPTEHGVKVNLDDYKINFYLVYKLKRLIETESLQVWNWTASIG